jgi:hypothetical protein
MSVPFFITVPERRLLGMLKSGDTRIEVVCDMPALPISKAEGALVGVMCSMLFV